MTVRELLEELLLLGTSALDYEVLFNGKPYQMEVTLCNLPGIPHQVDLECSLIRKRKKTKETNGD